MNKKTSGLIIFVMVAFIFVSFAQIINAQGKTLESIAAKIQIVAETVGGSIVIIGWIIAGVLWLLAGGAPDKVNVAKKATFACVAGTIIVALASGANVIIDVIENAIGLK